MPVALALDALFGEPLAWMHPVVWIGRGTALLESKAPTQRLPALLYGFAMTAIVTGAAALFGAAVSRVARRLPFPLGLIVEAWTLKTTLSVRALIEAGTMVEAGLES